MSQIELGPDDTLYCAQCDIMTAFYHMELPAPLRCFFGLAGATASDLCIDTVDGKKVGPNT